jgi:hypothetical protein
MFTYGGWCWAALLAAALFGQSATAEVIFSYDATTGQLPTDQGWSAYEIDTEGPLTAANTAGTAADNANAAIEDIDGTNVLHLRDTLSDADFNLPEYFYPWTDTQQSLLNNNGLRFTMVFQGIPTANSGKGNVRFGFNGTVFVDDNDNIGADTTIEVLGLSSTLAPNDGQFHTLVINGDKNGANYEFSYTFDGGAATPLSILANPAPPEIEGTVYFGGQSSPGIGADFLVKSIVMETLRVPEPSSLLLLACAMGGIASILGSRRRLL